MKKTKKNLLRVLAVLVLLRILYIFVGGEVEKEYVTSGEYTLAREESDSGPVWEHSFIPNGNRLYSLELCFPMLNGEEESLPPSGPMTLTIFRGDEMLYRTGLTRQIGDEEPWRQIPVNLTVRPGDEYRLEIKEAEESGPASEGQTADELTVAAASGDLEATVVSAGGEMPGKTTTENFIIRFGYLKAPSLFDQVLVSFLWTLMFACCAGCVYHSEGIALALKHASKQITGRVGEGHAVCAVEVLTCMAIQACSGIPFEGTTRVILYAVSLLAALGWRQKREYLRSVTDTRGKRIGMGLLYVYGAFALVGQRCFIYPLDGTVTPQAVFAYLCAVVWMVPVLTSALWGYEQLRMRMFSDGSSDAGHSQRTGVLILLVVLLLLVPAGLNLIANNPGISDVDTYESFEKYAQNPYGMYNWHPMFYSLLLRQIQKVWNSTYAVILAQYFFWAYVQTELFLYLRKNGLRDGAVLVLAAITGLNASNMLFLNSIWKDIPYTCAVLWLTVILAKLVFDQAEYKKRWFLYLELIVSLCLIGLLRKNGIVTLALTAVVLLIAFRRNLKMILAFLLSAVCIFYVQGPLAEHYQVIEPGRRGMYIGLGQDILGVYYAGGEVSEEISHMILVMTKENTAEYDYNPTWAHQSYDLDVEPTAFVRAYLDTFVRNPVLMIRAVIAREDCLWGVFQGENARIDNINYTGTEDGDRRWNEFYDERVFTGITPAMSALTAYTAETQWIRTILWRCGLLTLMGAAGLVYLRLRRGRGRELYLFLPLAGQILSLLLSTGWTDFRYFWPINVLNWAILPLVLMAASRKEGNR